MLMAVMTTPQPDGVALEQKFQPVPSTDKMALDLEINGTSNRDETLASNHVDDVLPSDPALTKTSETTFPPNDASAEAIPTIAPVNGVANAEAFASNQDIVAAAVDAPLPVESQPSEDNSLDLSASQLPDTNTTAAEDPMPDSLPESQELSIPSAALAASESAIESAVDDVAPTSTVPPVVDAQESAMRNTTPPPVAQLIEAQEEQQPAVDINFDSTVDLLQGENMPDGTAVADVSGLELSGPIPEFPDLPTNTEPLQETSTDFPTEDTLALESEANATIGDDTRMEDLSTSSILQENNAPDTTAGPSMLPPKIAREREDDDEAAPSAKRPKIEDTADEDHKMEDAASAAGIGTNGEPAAAQPNTTSITTYEQKELIKILKNAARSKDGNGFRAPVIKLWPGIAEQYVQKIPNPTDLSTMEQKLKDSVYPDMAAFKEDVLRLASNATLFNGAEHVVAISATVVRDSLLAKIERIPPEPAPAPKKEKKIKKEPASDVASRTTAPRRPSRGASTTAGPVPAAETFALDPSTHTPLIRRDSSKAVGGRPKRDIHPPKNKDLPYSISRPKNKKFAPELKFCEQVLKELNEPKNKDCAFPFYSPVDPVALRIPNYFSVIKSPMDLQTIGTKLREHQYVSAKDFERDVRMIITNCFKFNPQGNPVRAIGERFEQLFNEKWAGKQQYLTEHSSAAASPTGSVDSEEEESEEEEEEAEAPSASMQSAAQLRLIEEQAKLITMMRNKKSKAELDIQQGVLDMVEEMVKKEGQAKVAPAKKAKKAKAPKAKKPAPVKKAAAPKKAATRQRYMGTLEKEVISNGIGNLPDEISNTVLGWIKAEQPGVDVADDGTLELDIDLVSVPTLWKIHGLIMQHCPEVDAETRKNFIERDQPRELAKPPAKKKNKPMSKSEQEQKIELLRNKANDFDRQNSGSQEPVSTVEPAADPESSGDEDSDSEEE